MSSFKIDIKNIDVVKANLKKITQKVADEVQTELNGFGENTVADAKSNLRNNGSIDEGHLWNSITHTTKGLSVEVVVAANYAAYQEFGTRKFAQQYVSTLPQEWQTFAAQFKGGGGGDFEQFVMRLTQWIKRKGIGATYNVQTHRRDRVGKQSAKTTMEADAYAIALYLLRNGIKPHPFLFPAVEANRIKLKENLKQVLNA